MEPSKDWAKQYSSGVRAFTLFENPAKNNTGVYMLVHFSPFNRENLREIKNDFNLGADFDNPGAYTTVYEREENTGACVDVCVEKRPAKMEFQYKSLQRIIIEPPPGLPDTFDRCEVDSCFRNFSISHAPSASTSLAAR